MVIEVDVLVDQIVGLLKRFELLAVDAFCFQDTEKIFVSASRDPVLDNRKKVSASRDPVLDNRKKDRLKPVP